MVWRGPGLHGSISRLHGHCRTPTCRLLAHRRRFSLFLPTLSHSASRFSGLLVSPPTLLLTCSQDVWDSGPRTGCGMLIRSDIRGWKGVMDLTGRDVWDKKICSVLVRTPRALGKHPSVCQAEAFTMDTVVLLGALKCGS